MEECKRRIRKDSPNIHYYLRKLKVDEDVWLGVFACLEHTVLRNKLHELTPKFQRCLAACCDL